MPDIITLTDLENQVGGDRVLKYFDDDGDNSVAGTDPQVVAVLDQAEGEMFSRMLRVYDKDALITYATNDPVFKAHIVWVACEIMSERHAEFTDDEGWGAYKAQYDRALKYFENLSKGKQRGLGEATAGGNVNNRGNVQPAPPSGTSGDFVFAPSKNAPTGHGGF